MTIPKVTGLSFYAHPSTQDSASKPLSVTQQLMNSISEAFSEKPQSSDLLNQFSKMTLEEKEKMVRLFQNKIADEKNQKINYDEEIKYAVFEEYILELLKKEGLDPSACNNRLIKWCAGEGHEKAVAILLKDARVDPGVNNNEPINAACLHHRSPQVVRQLLAHERVNPSSSVVSEWACKSGIEDVLLLLENPRYKPDESMIRWLAENNEAALLAEILKNPLVKFDYGNSLLESVCYKGHSEVVTVLLTCRFASLFNKNEIFRLACSFGQAKCAQVLLDNGADPAFNNNAPILSAKNGEVTRLLLKDSRVDPKVNNSLPLIYASARGNLDVVIELLKDGRADPTAMMGACVMWAHQKKHPEIIKVLMADVRVNPHQHLTYEEWFRDPSRVNYETLDWDQIEIIPISERVVPKSGRSPVPDDAQLV